MSRPCCQIAQASAARFCGVCGRQTRNGKRSRALVHDEAIALSCLVLVALGVLAVLPYARAGEHVRSLVIEDDDHFASGTGSHPWEPQPVTGRDAEGAAPSRDRRAEAEAGQPAGNDTDRMVTELLRSWGAPSDGSHPSEPGPVDPEESPAEAPASPTPSAGLSGPHVPVTYRLHPGVATASSYTSISRIPGLYHPRQAIDDDASTGWQVSDGGVGEWIQLDFPHPVQVTSLGVIPGYDKIVPDRIGDRWPLNNRVSDVLITWDGGSRVHHFVDNRTSQRVELGGVPTSWVRIEITGIYPGSRWNDTIISEIRLEGTDPAAVF